MNGIQTYGNKSMENKSTLSWYKLYKHNIKEEKWFDK